MSADNYELLENLADLKFVIFHGYGDKKVFRNENAILEAVQKRYEAGQIYTFVGSSLIALNPAKNAEIYDIPIVDQYLNGGPFSSSAHIFSVGCILLNNIKKGSKKEFVVLTGNSGSGKTVNAYHLMRFLSSAAKNEKITSKHISALQIILDRFAGAKTLRSNNSTRCAILYQYFYQNSYLKGMKLSCVLPLELNRLVLQKSGEGNFSIFYQLCAGLTFDDREKLGIKGANQFFYLNQGKSNIVVQNEAELFAEFDAAMKYIKFSEHQRNIVYKLLAVILHLGNLYFRESPTNSDIVEVANESELKWIAFLLEVDVEKLRNLLLMQTKKCKDEYNENVIYENVPVTSIDKALDIRDSVTKTIYQELFNWILDHVSMLLGWNLDLEENSELNVVSVVDLYGFTRYNTNHFDEFCVNSANEQLHHLFIQQTFKNLLQSYENENIASDYSMPNGLDNERVVGMLFYRPCGLFPLLNDESKFPKGTNEAFLQRAGINHLDKSIFAKPRSKDRLEFGIKHYAGMTYYSVEDFLENNKWSKVGGVHDLISSSNDPLLAYMMKAEDSNQDRTIYLAEELFQAIDRLCELMSNHTIHFIKCIQVNMDGKSASFEANFVGKQMKALKIQEHYRLSQYAFPCKFGFEDFISNYRCLLPIEVISYEEPQKLVSDILHGQGNRFDGDYLIGSHNVYLKENLVKQLDFAKQQLQNVSALILQRNVRKYLIRKSYKKKINAAVTVQTAIRGWIARKLFEELKQERMEKMNPPVPTFPPPPPTEDQSKAKQCGKRFLGGFKTTTNYLPLDHKIQEPITESMSLEEFAEIYLKNHILGARREPILSPFLFKETEEMFQMSLQIFKLILKYTTDFGSTPNQYYDFAKSIIQFGIDNLDQRDEIYVQLCNQTYDNKSIEQTKKTWDLLLMAVNSFPPGALTFPMLKDYFGQQTETLRSNLLRGLYRPLRHPENNRSRLFAPTILEQQAAIKRQSTVVQIRLPTKEVVNVEIDAVTTSDEIVDRCLRMKGLVDVEGWGLNVETADFNGVISNGSFIFDGLSQFEALTNENDYLVKFKTFFKSNDDQSSNAVNDAEILRKSIGMMKSNGKYRVTPEEYAKMSVASRIRNMKIPASNGDVNKFLDEVFDQVLPPNEEFASALAASIKGGALYDAYSTDPNPNSWRQHYLPNSYDSPNRQNANSVISSINLSNHDGRDSRSTLYSPQDYPRTLHSPRDMSRVLFSPSSMNDERVSRMYMNDDEYFRNSTDNLQTRPPTTMAVSSTEPFRPSSNNHGEKNRLGQLTPTSQRARYIGNSNPSSNIRQIVKRFESPAMERKLKHSPSSPSRSKSTPRSFAAPVDTAHPVVHPSQTEENFTDARSPRQYAHPRSTSSTPHRVFSPDMNNDIHTARVEAVRKLHRNAAGLPPTSPPMPRIPMHKQQPQTFDQPANKHQNQNIKNDNVNGHIQKTVNHQAEKPVDNGRWVYDCEVDREQPLNLSFSQMSGKTNGFDDNLNQSNYADFVPKYEPQTPNSPAVTYIEEPWQLTIRREVFYPGEKLDDLDTIDLIFAQIIADCRKSNPHRIRQFEKDRINFILNKHQVPVESLNNASEISTNIKTEIINEVRKWPLYFCRMYPVILEKENVRTFMVFAVGENGIRLMTRNVENLEDPMVPQEHFDFSNIAEVLFEPPETIKLITKHEIVTKLTCKQARQAVEFIHRFLQNSQQQKVFVSALVDYQIRKPNLLSFHRGDIIQIVKEKGQDGPPAAGNWLYGKIGNRFGWFPAEYVDYVQPDKSELELGSEIYASNSITNSFYAPPSHFKTNSTILYGSVNQKPENYSLFFQVHLLTILMDSYQRSRSQSRFPPIDEHPGGFPTGQPLGPSQRSKSLDNRRDFEHGAPEDFGYDRSLERNSTLHASIPRRQKGAAGGDFFNETITIPTQQSNRASGKQFSSQREEGADDDWTSYDRKVRYQHERTMYPTMTPHRERYFDEGYSYRSPPAYQYQPQGLSPRSAISRYPDTEYYQRSQGIQLMRPLEQSRSVDVQSGQQRENVEKSGDYRYFDEDSAAVIPAHRAAANAAEIARSGAAGGGGGHRNYQYHYESHGGAGAGAGRQGYANGGYYKEKRSGGSWVAGSREPRVYSVLEDQNAVYGIPRAERLTMAEFAIKYFRQPKNSNFGSLTLGRKEKEWTWQDILDKIKFVDKPISHSLLNLGSNELDRLAVDLFVCVMRYMSDLGMKKGQTITDCVYEILSTCHNSPMLIDEVYCQIIKQTTSNRSPKTDSLLLGWRLFTIFTAYFPASEVFQPYLLKHLTDIAEDPRRPFNGTANLCLLNYQQTLRYGGRKFILTASEIEAITGGKNVRRQAYELPGGVKKYISTRTVTVAEEIIKELCLEMNIFSEAEQHEFTVCYILENDNSLRVLNNDEYILDVISELDSRNENFTLILTRTVWIYPLREDNELYINTLFFQMVPNYMAGLLTILPANPTSVLPARTLDDAATLGALLYFASDAPRDDLTANIVSSVIPRTVNERSRLSAANWLSRINHKISILPPDFNEQKARLAFLKYIEHWSLYGSSFYFVSNCELPNKTFGRPVLAINKNGLKILDANSMEVLWSCSISEIRSSRKYVDHNVGFLDVHINESHSKNPTVLIVETDSGSEIARVIGQYIYLNKQKPSYNHRHDI
uniref:Uncharacterized protein n=1 Tax=Panagrolaimus sp. JU765 TaxID=591449 RepID=A0AC34Q1U1_9BILA